MATLVQPQSFYITALATSMSPSDLTMQVTTAPTKTEGFLVIERESSANREIVKYTGVTGTTLTGLIRGLSFTTYTVSAGTGLSHGAGSQVEMTDTHYYAGMAIDVLKGQRATGENSFAWGDGNTISAANRFIYTYTSSLSAFIGLSSSGQYVVSEDGTNSYVISAGGSGLTAGAGIAIVAGAITTANLSTGGIVLSASKNAVGVSSGIFRDANGIGVLTTSAMTWTGAQTMTSALRLSADLVLATGLEINTALDGIVSTVTATNLGTITNGSNADSLHYHTTLNQILANQAAGYVAATIDLAYYDALSDAGGVYTGNTVSAVSGGSSIYKTNTGIGMYAGLGNYDAVALAGNTTFGSSVEAMGLTSGGQTGGKYAWNKDFYMSFAAAVSAAGQQDIFIGMGNEVVSAVAGNAAVARNATTVLPHVGIFVTSSTYYFSNADGSTQLKTNLSAAGLTAATFYNYFIDFDAGTQAVCYINGVARVSHTTNLPTVSVGFNFVAGVATTNASEAKSLDLGRYLTFAQKT